MEIGCDDCPLIYEAKPASRPNNRPVEAERPMDATEGGLTKAIAECHLIGDEDMALSPRADAFHNRPHRRNYGH